MRFFETIYRAGCLLRGTPVFTLLEQLNESQWWSRERFLEFQLTRLRELLAHAREHSPFYRRYFGKHGFDRDIVSLDDLKILSPLGKEDLIANRDSIQNKGRGGRLIHSETSGSTGVPFTFYRSSDWDAQHRAAILRGYGWYGVDPWMPSGLLWGIPASPSGRLRMRIEDFLQNRFRPRRFDLDDETLEDIYQRLSGARFLEGYSSMIYELARFVNREHPGEGPRSLRLVKGTSEKIHPHYQEEAVRAFGRPITSEYGAAETGIIAFECPQGNMHVTMEHVIAEIEDDEIVVTNLLSFSFPFIRYRLGDFVRIGEDRVCPCRRRSPIIEEVTGRVGKRILGTGGRSFPSLTIYYILKAIAQEGDLVSRCQAAQRRRGSLELLAVPAADLTDPGRAKLNATFERLVRHYYGDAITCSVSFVEQIPRGGAKQVDFVSEIEEAD
ncbi:MAG: phenylacetate--CoA ligase family protein [bacterium]|nr:MAG: phenylacetate--CoA ligase family protein [bacterium]